MFGENDLAGSRTCRSRWWKIY